MGESIDVYTNGAKAMSVQEADKTGSLLHTFLYVIVVDIIMAIIIVIIAIWIFTSYNTLLISSPFTGERHLCSSSFMAIIFSFFSVTTPITAASTPFCPK